MTRVLVVDDKEENLYYLQALLTGHSYQVETARHGAEALIKARAHLPDVVVSDLLMPVMDGYTLLRHWKTDLRLKRIPFIVYTATYTEPADEELAVSLGADAFILKPSEPDDFLQRLRAVLAKGAAVPAEPNRPTGDDKELLKTYSEALIRKLEEKTLQLEESNRTLERDIAERKRVEESLRESEERLRATFEQAAVGIAHVDVDGKYQRVNDKLCEMTGFPREELLQKTFADLTFPEDRSGGEEARRGMLARAQHSYSAEKRYVRKNGSVFWVHVVTTLLRDAGGSPKYFISVYADVTERKLLQEQFLRAQRMESIGTLAGGIAHDLNNLLTPIVVSVGLLRFETFDEDSLKIIETIERSAQRGASLVKQVLSFARGVEGARVSIHLGDLAGEIKDFVQTTLPKNISLVVTVLPNTWLIHGDPTQLNQVLLNLCVNARDAMPEGGRLTLHAENTVVDEQYAAMLKTIPPGRYVSIEVSDNGTGMPPEVIEHIFEPFFTTKAFGKGTGLGLSTVMSIVRSHGGSVNVVSTLGRGTVFKILLPALADSTPGPVPTPEAKTPARGHDQTVLLVEDDASVLAITRQTLETFGYKVMPAEDGAQAITMYALHQSAIAVVLMDMMMPGLDGTALIKGLRRINPSCRIICVSGLPANEEAANAAGANLFLLKPYTAGAIVSAVNRAVTGPGV